MQAWCSTVFVPSDLLRDRQAPGRIPCKIHIQLCHHNNQLRQQIRGMSAVWKQFCCMTNILCRRYNASNHRASWAEFSVVDQLVYMNWNLLMNYTAQHSSISRSFINWCYNQWLRRKAQIYQPDDEIYVITGNCNNNRRQFIRWQVTVILDGCPKT